MVFNRKNIDHGWFFTNTSPLLRLLGIYVNGDKIILLPLLLFLTVSLLINVRFGLVGFGIYFAVRGLGEMMYWMFHQFGPKTYKPPGDFGFPNLSNDGVYVLYQLMALVHVVLGFLVVLGVVLWKF